MQDTLFRSYLHFKRGEKRWRRKLEREGEKPDKDTPQKNPTPREREQKALMQHKTAGSAIFLFRGWV